MTTNLSVSGNQHLDLVRPAHITDGEVIRMWLHGQSINTQQAYFTDIQQFLELIEKPLREITLADVQEFDTSLLHLASSTRKRKLSAVKSLLSFGNKIGYLLVNVGVPIRLPAPKNTLAERILSEADVHKMIALETNTRNRVLLTLLYSSGIRVSELCGLTWRDLQERGDAGQITVFGKGSKTRTILLTSTVWRELLSLKGEEVALSHPVFRSRKGGKKLDRSQVFRIVQAAAAVASIPKDVSCHWLRHAHASHALDRGAPIHLVQETLGHESVATTGKYLHARPTDSSSRYLSV